MQTSEVPCTKSKVESKSQRGKIDFTACYQMYKELKLKANHNYRYYEVTIVFGMLPNVQRAKVESKSQHSR